MSEERNGKRTVQIVLKVQVDGYGADITADLLVAEIAPLVRKLRDAGVEPANSPYVWSGQPQDRVNGTGEPAAPVCPVHGVAMKKSKHKDGWYCTRKDGDDYCKQVA